MTITAHSSNEQEKVQTKEASEDLLWGQWTLSSRFLHHSQHLLTQVCTVGISQQGTHPLHLSFLLTEYLAYWPDDVSLGRTKKVRTSNQGIYSVTKLKGLFSQITYHTLLHHHVVALSVAEKDKTLMEASRWERLTEGETLLMGGAMLSKSLIQFSVI